MAGFNLFNYAKEGPGVAKNAPKKRTFFDFMEIYGRKFWKLAIAGLLWALVSLPILTRGLADAGLTRITRSYTREKHAFLREDFFESIKKNAKTALPIGIINTLVTGIFIYNILSATLIMMPDLTLLVGVTPAYEARNLTGLESIIFILSLMGYVTFTWMKYYIPFLMITFKLKKRQIYKNAFLFAGANMKVNLAISAILIVIYVLLLGILALFPSAMTLALLVMLCITIVPAFRSFLIQYSIFPAIKRLIIDPYYEANPNADKQARIDLGLDVEEDTAPVVETVAQTEETAPAEEEVIFTDTVPVEEEDVPKRVLPKQYNEKELRRFNRQVQQRVTDDDDDTI